MRLYTDKNGRWVGTQAEAKKLFGEVYQVEVPTDKAALMEYLNDRRVVHGQPPENVFTTTTVNDPVLGEVTEIGMARTLEGNLPKTVSRPDIPTPHSWQTIRECAEKASIKDLTVAMAVMMNRVDKLADKVGDL